MLIHVVTVKHMKVCKDQRIENGMTADVVTNMISNHVGTNSRYPVRRCVFRLYGVDLRRIGARGMVYLDVKKTG